MITGHYFVGRVEAVAKPDFLECLVGFRFSTHRCQSKNMSLVVIPYPTYSRRHTFRTAGALGFAVLGAIHLSHRWC